MLWSVYITNFIFYSLKKLHGSVLIKPNKKSVVLRGFILIKFNCLTFTYYKIKNRFKNMKWFIIKCRHKVLTEINLISFKS